MKKGIGPHGLGSPAKMYNSPAKKGEGRAHFKKGAEINKQERKDVREAKRTARLNRAQRAADARTPEMVQKTTKHANYSTHSYKAYEAGDLKKGYTAANSKDMKYTLKERLDNRKQFRAEKKKLVSQARNKAAKARAKKEKP